MTHPTQDQLLNAAIMLDGAHPAVAAWLVRMAEQQAAAPVAWGLGNTAITGSNRWMMLREQVPADDQYGGAMWTPLYTHPAPTQQPLTDAAIDSLYQHMAADERTKPFTAQNWFQAGVASAEAALGITGSKT